MNKRNFSLALTLLPFTALSVYYQAVKLRSYCWLCLLVAALLWLEAGLSVAAGVSLGGWPWGAQAWLLMVMAWGGTTLAWLGLRPLLAQAWQGRAVALQRPASPLDDAVPPHMPGAWADMLDSAP